ncbi:hypothetical protein GCM10022223_61200 [Kineosporia mesophila]|uniref:VTT domain-containing protein n=1 Tax=Kineosporia mesophila TaxID=566012 RepID=A0ABP7AKU6_9ACTN|nr:VTT domain-containing protein [Kineosporia mesophila]MCD5355019.1 VTT domain-containing protein [Kineosporia mesophila]
MTFALTVLLSQMGPAAVLLLALIIFAETGLLVGFFLPGDSLLFAAGLLVANGTVPVPLVVVIGAVWAAASLGDQLGYWIGGRIGPRLFGGRPGRWIRARHVDAAREFFDRHGSKAVITARFVALVRTFTPVVAGAVGMPRRRFTVYNVAGGLLWTAGMLLSGYFLGAIPFVADHVELTTLALDALVVTPAVVAFLIRWWRRPPDGAMSAAHRGAGARAVAESGSGARS